MREVVQRHAPQGPGPKGSPKHPIVKRWSQGSFKYAALGCGHEVRVTKMYEWKEGTPVPCAECPR